MDTEFAVEKYGIAKLSGHNFRSWKVQVQTQLEIQSLWDIVSSDKETSNKVKDAKARATIMSTCTADVLEHILLLKTAKEQWQKLETEYAPLGARQLSTKIQAFTGYKPTGKTTITEVAMRLNTLQYEIGVIDPSERPSENLKIAIFLKAIKQLNDRFNPLVLQLQISDNAKDFNSVVSWLKEYEQQFNTEEPLKETAFSAKDSGSKYSAAKLQKIRQSSPRSKFTGRCFKCNKVGHRQAECRSKKASTGPLATPSGGRGLSPPPNQDELKQLANSAVIEEAWTATEATEKAYSTQNSPTELT